MRLTLRLTLLRLTQGVLVAALLVSACPVLAQDGRPDARLEFSSISAGLLFGFSRGQGSLAFQGQTYPFTVSGISVATVGISKVATLGQVYRLRDVADFAGRYFALGGGLTLIQGGGSAVLRNEKGVTLYLQNLQYGFDVTLGGGGLSITLLGTTQDEASSPPVTEDAPATPSTGEIVPSAGAH